MKRTIIALVAVSMSLLVLTPVVLAHDPFEELWQAIFGINGELSGIHADIDDLKDRVIALEASAMIPTPEPEPEPEVTPCQIAADFIPGTVNYRWGNPECYHSSDLEGNVEEGFRYGKNMEFKIDNPSDELWVATLSSETVDTYLLLYEWQGEELLYQLLMHNDDDEGAGGTNSRLWWVPQTDVYYSFWITTYSTSDTGEFEFTLEPAGD